ncbi:unnamed protein product [Arabidopsis halleri]
MNVVEELNGVYEAKYSPYTTLDKFHALSQSETRVHGNDGFVAL